MSGSPPTQLTFQGKTQTLNEWAAHFRMKPRTLKNRLNMGWTLRKSLTWPVKTRQREKKQK